MAMADLESSSHSLSLQSTCDSLKSKHPLRGTRCRGVSTCYIPGDNSPMSRGSIPNFHLSRIYVDCRRAPEDALRSVEYSIVRVLRTLEPKQDSLHRVWRELPPGGDDRCPGCHIWSRRYFRQIPCALGEICFRCSHGLSS